jgi:hypothetical protein
MNKLLLAASIAIALMASAGAGFAQDDDTSPTDDYVMPSECVPLNGSLVATNVCQHLDQPLLCGRVNFCWWRDTTNQNALAEYSQTDFLGDVVNPYSSASVKVWVWNANDGANVIAIETSAHYFLIGAGANTADGTASYQAIMAAAPDLSSKTLAGILLNSMAPDIAGGLGVWTGGNTSIPIYVHENWVPDTQMETLFTTAWTAQTAEAAGVPASTDDDDDASPLAWGVNGFLGAGVDRQFNPYAPTSSATENMILSATEMTTIVQDGVPFYFLPNPTGLTSATIAVYLPIQKILILGGQLGNCHSFPDIAPIGLPAGNPLQTVASLNTLLSLTPNYIIFQNGFPYIIGNATCMQALTDKRNAVQCVETQTELQANALVDVDTAAAAVTALCNEKTPTTPWTNQFSTTVADVVRAIYSNNLGQYGGSPANMAYHGLTEADRATRLVALAKPAAILAAAKAALQENTADGANWAVYLAHALVLGSPSSEATTLYQEALQHMAFETPSASVRNVLLLEAQSAGAPAAKKSKHPIRK